MLASGAAVPIASVKPGEKVLATNTKTGKTSAEAVAAVVVHHDTNRYDLTIKTERATAVIKTTTTHLFWNPVTRQWVKATALSHGSYLRTPGGGRAIVVGRSAPRRQTGWMWDLTVTHDHDFYVDTSAAAVLVHNTCNVPEFRPWKSKIKSCIAGILFALHVHWGAIGDPPEIGGFIRPTPVCTTRTEQVLDQGVGPGAGGEGGDGEGGGC